MSLKGSLQTVALPEVLRFLSGTGKSGEFHVSGANGDGRLWFDTGRISGFQARLAAEPYEAIFEMLRISDGDFDFTADRERPADAHPADSVDLDSTIEAAEQRMTEWARIVEVVPSLAHRISLKSEAPGERVELAASQWSTVVTISRGGTVGEVIDARGLPEFDGCAAVRDLVEAGLVEISEPADVPADALAEVAEVAPVIGFEPFEAPAEVAESDDDTADVEPDHGFEPIFVIEPVSSLAEPEHQADTEPEHEAGAEPASSFGSDFQFDAGAEPVADVEVVHDEDAIPAEMLRFGSQPDEADAAVSSNGVGADDEQAVVELGEDHYAALRAAVVEVGENLDVDGDVTQAESAGSDVYELNVEPELDGRAALQALLSEVTTPDDSESPVETVDGLADRGPWTEHELSAMEADRAEEETSNIVPLVPVSKVMEGDEATDQVEGEAPGGSEPSEEPINRGLLLKFLSSVRN